jgi:hypothetical protein
MLGVQAEYDKPIGFVALQGYLRTVYNIPRKTAGERASEYVFFIFLPNVMLNLCTQILRMIRVQGYIDEDFIAIGMYVPPCFIRVLIADIKGLSFWGVNLVKP